MSKQKPRVCSKCHQYLVNQKITAPIVWVIGGPGCGKGTQCQKIAERFKFQHISTGHIVSREIKTSRTHRGKAFVGIVESGKLIPNEAMIEQLKTEMYKHIHTAKGFAVDGYPCNKEQGILFEKNIAPVDIMFFLELPTGVHVARILKRGETSGRIDDNEDTVKKRLEIFLLYKNDLLEHFKHKVVMIDADRPSEMVFRDIQPYIENLILEKGYDINRT